MAGEREEGGDVLFVPKLVLRIQFGETESGKCLTF